MGSTRSVLGVADAGVLFCSFLHGVRQRKTRDSPGIRLDRQACYAHGKDKPLSSKPARATLSELRPLTFSFSALWRLPPLVHTAFFSTQHPQQLYLFLSIIINMKLSYSAFVVALVGTSYHRDLTPSITTEAFVPHLHYARYQQRIANTQLHYVNDDEISELAFGDLMEMTLDLEREDGDDITMVRGRPSSSSTFPLVKQMASFVASEFLKRQTAVEVDPIRFLLTTGVLPETMTLAQQSSHLSVLAAQSLLLGAAGDYQVDLIVKKKNPSPTTISAQVSSTQQNSSDGLPSCTVVSNEILLNRVDPAVPFFAKPKATRPTPFFAKLPTTTSTTTTPLPIDPIELEETLSKDTQDVSKVVLAWPTILTPEMTVQQALDHVQNALGGLFSTTASKAVASISNVVKESSTTHPPLAELPISIEQQVVQPAKEWLSSILAGETVAAFISKNSEIMTPAFSPKSTLKTMPTTTSPSLQDWMKFVTVVTEEVTTQAFELAMVSQERVSTFFGSSSKDVLSFLPRPAFFSTTTPRPVIPRPPQSPPSEDLLASHQVEVSNEDKSTSTSACLVIDEEGVSVLPPSQLLEDGEDSPEGCVAASMHQELDLQDIDDVLKEAEWALKVADAAFQ